MYLHVEATLSIIYDEVFLQKNPIKISAVIDVMEGPNIPWLCEENACACVVKYRQLTLTSVISIWCLEPK